jgi:hypothetical protein
MNCEIYVDGIKLDLFNDESITMKFIRKDTQDLSKVFAPFSKGFSIPATPKNLQTLKFFGDTSLVRVAGSSSFDCKIYLHGILNKEGELKIENVKYENNKVKTINVAFNSKLVSLKDRIGDDNIADLGTFEISRYPNIFYQSVRNTQLSSGGLVWYTPLISRSRVWSWSPDIEEDDNIFFRSSNSPLSSRVVLCSETRPAVSVKSLWDLIKTKYNLNINMPLENRTEFTRAYIWANGEEFKPPRKKLILTKQYSGINTSVNFTDSSVTLNKPNNSYGMNFLLKFNTILFLDSAKECNLKVTLVNKSTGEEEFTEDVSVENLSSPEFRVKMRYSGTSAFSKSYFIYLESDIPISWASNNSVVTYFRLPALGGNFTNSYTNNVTPIQTGLYIVNLLNAIPETKVIDFITSIIKTYNISIFESSENNGQLDFLTPTDIKNQAQVFGYKEIDYTAYVSKLDVDKKVLPDFNYYSLKHKTNKYRSSSDFRNLFGIEYGQATFPAVKPEKAKEYLIETGFSIIPPVPLVGRPEVITAYGFTDESPEIVNGFKRYTPNTEDLTIFFKRPPAFIDNVGCQNISLGGALINSSLAQYQPTSPLSNILNGVSLGFSILLYSQATEPHERSLYSEYYDELISRMLDPNTLEHAYELTLPTKELVYSQGTTIQPNGYRLQNQIIIQENRFEISEMDIDLTTGKAKAKLINI